MGLPVANQGFLQALIKYGGLETRYAYTSEQARFGQTFEQLARDLGATMPARVLDGHRLDQLAEVGGLGAAQAGVITGTGASDSTPAHDDGDN